MARLEPAGEGPGGEQAGEQSAEARAEQQSAGVPGADGSPQSLLRQEALGLRLWLRLRLLQRVRGSEPPQLAAGVRGAAGLAVGLQSWLVRCCSFSTAEDTYAACVV